MSIFSDLGVREGKDDRVKEEILYNLAACYSLAERRISFVLKGFGLSPVKMNVLLMLRHVKNGSGLSQAELGKRMIVSAGNITRLIDRLEKEDLVRHFPKKGDRRVKLIGITKNGEQALDKAWPHYKQEVERIVSIMPKVDMVMAGVALSGLRENLQKTERKGAL